jgi:signal transduction histidine kinase/CheY-like chemotaxis protein
MTALPWWPIEVVDIAGSTLALILGLLCVLVARRLRAEHAEDVFVAYLWIFSLIVLVFVGSRSVGHLVKQILVLMGHDQTWAAIAPFSGAINTATFVALFVISALFGIMVRLKERVRRSATEAAEARARAEESEAETLRLNAVFEGVNVAIYVCGADGQIKYFNRKLQELFPDVRLGAPCHELLCPTPIDTAELPRTHADFGPRFGFHTTDNKRVLSISAVPIEWTDRSQVRLVAAFDVTELRRAQEQLRHAQKMEAIGTLAGGIAHDFNNILCGIVGYGELARLEVEEGTHLHDCLMHIEEASHRARELVKRILTFARESEQEQRPLNIKPLLSEALKLVRASFPTTLEIRSTISSESVVLADASRIHQVILNLCTNAATAIGDQPGVLEVELDDVNLDETFAAAHPGLSVGRHVRLRVTDNGCGMTPEVRERIFEPFFTTRSDEGGTGLGLSVVHGILSGCKGAITVYSEPGTGTTFNVFLPIAEAQSSAEVEPRKMPRGKGERVLFVDDEPANAELASAMLAYLGYRVTVATASQAALATFQASPGDFDIVIADLTMPKMRGDSLAGAIRAIRPDVPVLLTTGYSESRAHEWRSRGGQVLPKPFSMQEIASAIRSCLPVSDHTA